MLLRYCIPVYINRKNSTNSNFTTERVLHWSLLLEECVPAIKYIKVPGNYAEEDLRRLQLINSGVA